MFVLITYSFCYLYRAGPSLSAFNYDSNYGKRALAMMYRGIMEQVFIAVSVQTYFVIFFGSDLNTM